MTTPRDTTALLSLHDHGELAAAVPHLIGFRPANSLTVVTLTGTDPPRLGVTIRVDLPPPWHVDLVAETVTRPAVAQGVQSAALVLFGSAREDPATPPGGWTAPDKLGPPHRLLVSTVDDAMSEAGIEVRHAMWLPRCEAGQTWWCYEDPECTGQLPDPASTELAAITALAGDVTFRSRDEMADLLAPGPRKAWRRTASLLSSRAPDDVPDRPLSLLLDAMDRPADLPKLATAASAERVADMVSALRAPDVRAACLSMTLDERAPGAERLWTMLTRATPPPWRAEPACLVAMSAYVRGNGALASMAVEVALDADPDHSVAVLLEHALHLCLPPSDLRRMLTDMAEAPGLPDISSDEGD